MKHSILLLLCIILIMSCTANFDELKDTTQRNITVYVDCNKMFEEVLIDSKNGYTLGTPYVIPDSMCLRVNVYCYNGQDSIITKSTVLTTDNSTLKLPLRHLEQDTPYNIVVVADIVKYDAYVDYYETWFQLTYSDYKSFKLFSFNKGDNPVYNVILKGEQVVIPENQSIDIPLQSITYNGFCQFTNASNLDKLSGYLGYADDFMLKSMSSTTYVKHDYSYFMPNQDTITIPVTMSKTKDDLYIEIITNRINRKDTALFATTLNERPFTVTIDCSTLNISDITEY